MLIERVDIIWQHCRKFDWIPGKVGEDDGDVCFTWANLNVKFNPDNFFHSDWMIMESLCELSKQFELVKWPEDYKGKAILLFHCLCLFFNGK